MRRAVEISMAEIRCGDSLRLLPELSPESVDAIITDPPYHLTTGKKGGSGAASLNLDSPAGRARVTTGFMGMVWDGGDVAFRPEVWAGCLRVAKPGAHLLAFGGTRTFHRLMVAIEDAGWEIRDTLMWVYGSGFPKSLNLDGEHEGWGTALKPAWEPIVMARKPLVGTVAANVAEYGCGALNIDGCRVGTDAGWSYPNGRGGSGRHGRESLAQNLDEPMAATAGRWPANLIHDGSEEVVGLFPQSGGGGGKPTIAKRERNKGWCNSSPGDGVDAIDNYGDSGSAARFFYVAKASGDDRGEGNDHPTVKPTDLMRWLCRLVTPPGGLVLDPFTGSGSTGKAARAEGMRFLGFEINPEYCEIARRRIDDVAPLFGRAT